VTKRNVVLVQPREGVYGNVLKPWVPLSLLCASSNLDEDRYAVKIIDQRVTKDWQSELREALSHDPVCVGITSMTGSQILGALEASELVKENGNIPVVWGGVHCSLFSEQTLAHKWIDIIIKGEGEVAFAELVERLAAGLPLDGLDGVWHKKDGEIKKNPDRPYLDLDDTPEPPYHLVNLDNYLHQFFSEKRVLELESSRGCPYSCAFCYNPLYSNCKWRPLSAERVVSRIEGLVADYDVHAFHFLDDAFFIDRKRVRNIMQGVLDSKLDVRMGFQGIRVDTLSRMSDEELDLIYRAGGRYLQFGVESGSPRIMEMINKKIRVEDVVALNRRLGRYKKLIPYYNLMCGFPTETREELFQTTALAWTLLQDNRNALISPFHHFKPYPGTSLAETVLSDKRFSMPQSLEEWGTFDWTEVLGHDKDKKAVQLLKKVEMTSILADKKMERQSDSLFWTIAAKAYRPIAKLRLKYNFYAFMPEVRFMK
jgi:anaerobic magnesium-protoporphyrin IX monomethyl ester cyclase